MGTIREWIEVFLACAFLVGANAWISVRRRVSARTKPVWSPKDSVRWALAGLWFGIVYTFGWWRAFHKPLVLITLPLTCVGVIVGWFLPTIVPGPPRIDNPTSHNESK